MNQPLKNAITLVFLIILITLSTSCSSDEGSELSCDDISASLQATISSDVTSVCTGEKAMLTITGTPNSEVSYNDGSAAKTVNLDDSGSITLEVSPTATTDYALEKIMQEDCEKVLTEQITIVLGGPAISENIIGTWSVINANDQTDGKTVTFSSDGTGMAPMDGSFTIYSSTFDEYSDGFTWEYQSSLEHLVLSHQFIPLNFPVHYEVDLNDCDEVILRDVTHVVDPQNTYQLSRQ